MSFNDIKKIADNSLMNTYGRFPLCAASGKGARLIDTDGREYIDFASGIGVNSLGFCDDEWADAVSAQAHRLNHVSNLYYSDVNVELADKLTRLTGFARVFFANGGGETNEGAIKLARKYSFDKYGEGRHTILTLRNSFHGRTVTTLAATGQDVFHNFFFPFTEGFKYTPANDVEALKAAVDKTVCAIMIEVVQGEGGVNPLSEEFTKAVFEIARKNDILVIADEVQTGIARTGKLLASEYLPEKPDIVTLAKGLGGGLPIGAMLCGENLKDVLGPGTHATTFGGNPIVSAGALVVLDRVANEDFLSEVIKKGDYIRKKFAELNSPHLTETRGLGLMIGVKVEGMSHKELCAKLIDAGLLALTAGSDTLRLLPPLTIPYEDIDAGFEIIKKVLSQIK